jgi:hypothetical protein
MCAAKFRILTIPTLTSITSHFLRAVQKDIAATEEINKWTAIETGSM